MLSSSIERSPQFYARVVGFLYLANILLGLFGELFVRGALVVSGDAAATAHNIAASPLLWRAGIAGDLLMQVVDVPMIVIVYFLLRPVSASLSLLAALINVVQTAVLAANKLNLLVPLLLLEDARYAKAFSPEQLHALSQLAINAHSHGFAIGLVFFGVTCLVQGYLIFHSGYWPKALGVLMAMAGLSYLANSFALLLSPPLASALFPGVLVPAFVGELVFCLWLIVKGVNVAQWEQQLATRQTRLASR
jgi:hypothetical protein